MNLLVHLGADLSPNDPKVIAAVTDEAQRKGLVLKDEPATLIDTHEHGIRAFLWRTHEPAESCS